MSSTHLGPGDVLADRYHLRAKIGSGGVGDVWRAHDALLDRAVALKVLRSSDDLVLHDETLREARVASKLRADGIVTVFDVIERGPLVIIVMELLDGPTVKEEIQRRGTVTPRMARAVMTEVAGALAEAHAQHVVHRDIKPGNIFWLDDGRIVVCDFGLAKVGGADTTSNGAAEGTPEYMSPEQFRGDALGPAADVWAWGVTAHELVTGRAPFGKRSEGLEAIAIAARVTAGDPPPPLTLADDPELAAIVNDCLVRDPHARIPDGRALYDRLQRTDPNRRGAPISKPTPIPVPPPVDPAATAFVPPIEPTLADAPLPIEPTHIAPSPSAFPDPHAADSGPYTDSVDFVAPARPGWALPVLATFAVLLLVAGAAFGYALGQRSSPIGVERSVDALPLPETVTSAPDADTPLRFVRVTASDAAIVAEPGSVVVVRGVSPGTVLPATDVVTAVAGVQYIEVYDVVSGRAGAIRADAVGDL